MYGFSDVKESYSFKNQCSVKYGEWDMYTFYLKSKPKNM